MATEPAYSSSADSKRARTAGTSTSSPRSLSAPKARLRTARSAGDNGASAAEEWHPDGSPLLVCALHGPVHPLRRQRRLRDLHARRVKDGVGDRRCTEDHRWLADALHAVQPLCGGALDDDRRDAGHIGRRRKLVEREVRVHDAAVIEVQLFGESVANPLRCPPLHLALDVQGMHGETHVLCHDKVAHAHKARSRVHLDVGGVTVEGWSVEHRVEAAVPVSPQMLLPLPTPTPSSVATICAMPAITAPVPISAAPVCTTTVPSSFILTVQDDAPWVVVHQPQDRPFPAR